MIEIHNPTDKTIDTWLIRNGLWPKWTYLGIDVPEHLAQVKDELERVKSLGAQVKDQV